MTTAQARCPHCTALQEMSGVQMQPCRACGESFYPTPLPPPATPAERKQQARQILRSRAERDSEEPVALWQVIRGTGVFVLLIALSQLWFDAVMIGSKYGNSLVVFRKEEPARYWELFSVTVVIGVTLFAFGHYMLRSIRRTIDRRFPRDPP